MMVVALKHVGTTAWLSEMLKMSVKTSVSSTAQSLSTPPRNVVRTQSFACIDPAEGSPHAVRGQRHHLVAGRRWSLLCSGAVLCLKASKEGIQLVQQGDGAVTGLWWGLVVRNGLNPLPQAPSVSAVTETVGYPPGVLSLGLSDAAG